MPDDLKRQVYDGVGDDILEIVKVATPIVVPIVAPIIHERVKERRANRSKKAEE